MSRLAPAVFAPAVFALAVVLAPLSAHAQQASPAAAAEIEAAAQAYLDAYPVRELMADMTEAMSQQVPPAQQEQIRAAMGRVDMDAVEAAMRSSMVAHFTAPELRALAAFYTSPEGRSVMDKLPAYMADAMPAIQQEMMRAMSADQ